MDYHYNNGAFLAVVIGMDDALKAGFGNGRIVVETTDGTFLFAFSPSFERKKKEKGTNYQYRCGAVAEHSRHCPGRARQEEEEEGRRRSNGQG